VLDGNTAKVIIKFLTDLCITSQATNLSFIFPVLLNHYACAPVFCKASPVIAPDVHSGT
jgi:hypothetical protein